MKLAALAIDYDGTDRDRWCLHVKALSSSTTKMRRVADFFPWVDVSIARGELVLRAEHTKDRENRIIPVSNHVQRMLGHASLQQTSTYLNVTLRGLHESMRTLEQSRKSCKPLASKPPRDPRPARKQAPASDGNSLIH